MGSWPGNTYRAMTFRGTGIKGFAKGRAFVASGDEEGCRNIPEGSILVISTISLTDSASIDFKNVAGIVTEKEDEDGQVGTLASGLGIPAVCGIVGCTQSIFNGDRLLIRNLDVVVNPDLSEVTEFEKLRRASDSQLSLDL